MDHRNSICSQKRFGNVVPTNTLGTNGPKSQWRNKYCCQIFNFKKPYENIPKIIMGTGVPIKFSLFIHSIFTAD